MVVHKQRANICNKTLMSMRQGLTFITPIPQHTMSVREFAILHLLEKRQVFIDRPEHPNSRSKRGQIKTSS